MKALGVKLTAISLACLLTAGCKTVTVVPHALNCDASAELLASKCAAPRQIAGNTTYAMLVDTMQMDRQALQECGIAAEALRDSIRRCNRATDEYNKRIDELNNRK